MAKRLLQAISFVLITGFVGAFVPLERKSASLAPTSTSFASTMISEQLNTEILKSDLFNLIRSCDRGFKATPKAREAILSIIDQMERLNTESDAARGMNDVSTMSPMEGTWRLIFTTSPDQLFMNGNRFAPIQVDEIYQVIDPPFITNIIDFSPSFQGLLQPLLNVPTSFRTRIGTKAESDETHPNRISLLFEVAQFLPQNVLGQKVSVYPPLQVEVPQSNQQATGNGSFDVSFLDDNLLIIRHNKPWKGSVMVLEKAETLAP